MSDHKSFKMTPMSAGWHKHWAVKVVAVCAVAYGLSGLFGLR